MCFFIKDSLFSHLIKRSMLPSNCVSFFALSCIISACIADPKKDGTYYEIEMKSDQKGDDTKSESSPSIVEQVAEWLEKVRDREVLEKFDEKDFKLLVANLDDDTVKEIRSDSWPFKEHLEAVEKDEWMNDLNWSNEDKFEI
jgi:hypothetical protein